MRSLLAPPMLVMARSALALDVAGITIGEEMNFDFVTKLRNDGFSCLNSQESCKETRLLGDIQSDVFVQANDKYRVKSVLIRVPVARGADLLRAASGKFGKPTTRGTKKGQNAFSASFDVTVATWKRSDGVVTVQTPCSKITEACLLASDTATATAEGDKKIKL